jgi:beta-ketoacyl synthase-like protein
MLYIHQTSCISPMGSYANALSPRECVPPADGIFRVVEPSGYEEIPRMVLRRMSKAVRLGIGAALPLLREYGKPDGILIGTGNGGMEESVKFLRQIIDYEEGMLRPGDFVQSIPNAIASQIGLHSRNQGYNTTYVHRGLGFEHALIDARMLLKERPGSRWLVGGVDEVSAYHYQIELADGWYKKNPVPALSLYDYDTPGSMAGEGAALFMVDDRAKQAIAAITGILTLHSKDESTIKTRLAEFLERFLPAGKCPDLLVTGENGDNRALRWYDLVGSLVGPQTRLERYKHLCGEYPTASAFAVWLACRLEGEHILLYNNHKLSQHSLILLQRFR